LETKQKRVIALGFFDGVHLGHAALLKETTHIAQQMGLSPAVVTFDVHPSTFTVGQSVPLLNSKTDRADLMRRLFGINEVIFAHFDERMMRMSWEDFITDFLVQDCNAVYLVAGHDFHFGYCGQGNPYRLQAKCAELGIGCTIVPKIELDEMTISSSYIRTLVAQGEMDRAAVFLGHPHVMTGQVVHGKQLGKSLGFPTINVQCEESLLYPALGVYVTKVFFADGSSYPAVTNVGVRPTVDHEDRISVESFLLDFDGDLYDETVRLEFYDFLRPEQKFPSLDALKAEIARNVEQAREYFAQHKNS
jgi:riboflavin kinase/FMN adenylyltransferase